MTATFRIAYLNYGAQSGVTARATSALTDKGHDVVPVTVTGPLEPRDPRTGRMQFRWELAAALAAAAGRFGRKAYAHRWNTPFAFDVHTRQAERLLNELTVSPDVVLQNGALFAPGETERTRTVLLLDHTRMLSMRSQAWPDVGLHPAVDYGRGWFDRERRLYQQASLITTFSKRTAESVVEDYGVDPARVAVVGAGANVFPEKVERAHDGETLLFVGKDFDRKGGRVLLQAFAELRKDRPGVKLVIAGPHKEVAAPEGVTQVGFVDAAQLPLLFSKATFLVLPTLREPFGIAFLDAMACGVPCVGTSVGAIPEIIEHGRTGFIVPPGDHIALSRTLNALLSDVPLQEAMGAAGRQRVADGMLWSHVADRLDDRIRGLFARSGSAVAF